MGRLAEVWEYASLAHIRGISFAARHCKKRLTGRVSLMLICQQCDYARMPFAWRQALIATAEKPRTMIATNT